MPQVSIGLPVYNGERFLREAIDSLLAQTLDDFELIISDNASTDGTQEICETYSTKDRRIRYYRSEANVGAGRNYNRVFELSSGTYFKWAAHDDVCAPEFLEKCVAVLERDPPVVLCYPMMIDIDEEGRNLGRRYISHITRAERAASPKPYTRFRKLIKTDYTCEEIFGVIRADILRKTKLIQNYTDSDRTLLAELGLYGRFYEVPEVLFYHRLHKGMSTRVYSVWQERTAWFDPEKAGRPVFPLTRQMLEYFKSILRVRLRWHERPLCLTMMGLWFRDNWKSTLKELVDGFMWMMKGPSRSSSEEVARITGTYPPSRPAGADNVPTSRDSVGAGRSSG